MLRADPDHCEWLPDDLKTGEMVFIPGGTFRMGSDHHYPEEAPSHRAAVDGFWIDRTPVTNRQFKQFVMATGHVTTAEVPRPEGLSRRPAAYALCGLARVHKAAIDLRSVRLEPVVVLYGRRRLVVAEA